MNETLTKTTVLVLNRHWQAIDSKTPIESFSMMAAGNATALDIHTGGDMRPVTWEDWLKLEVREGDNSIGTVHGPVRVPSVLVLARFDKVPKRRPKFCAKAIWERDGGMCQYTGRKLRPHEGNIDHIIPVSRGGASNWENCVLACIECNAKKADRTPDQARMPLRREPVRPVWKPLYGSHGMRIDSWSKFVSEAYWSVQLEE